MASVVLANVSKRYGGDPPVVSDVSLEIEDHELTVLVGPSGCGKSTLLRMIAGLEEVTAGTISIGGRVVNDVPPKDRDIAMVFQSYALYPHMTVRQNLEFGLQIRKTPAAERQRRIEEAAQLLGIGELLARKPKELSGGQRQRVALGRAIVRKPAVFLFDEPLSNLDAKLRVQMRAEIKKLQARLEVTSVYVTHDQVEAMTMGHRIAVLHAGQLQQVGAPLDVYEKPANLRVAAFIGTPPMSLFDAFVSDGGTRLRARSFELPVPAGLRPALAGRDGTKLVAGLRAEDVVGPGRSPRGRSAPLALVVDLAEALGDEVMVHARAGDDALVFKQDPRRPAPIGSTIEVQVELDAVHLFDASTERRLGD